MAHLIDNSKGYDAFVSYAAPAWHGLGTILNNPLTTADALMQGGLDYEVMKLPNIHGLPDGTQIISEESFFTLRTDVNKVLGSRLGKDYRVMQNITALNLVDEILQSGKATIETAGAIDEGKKVFICMKVNKDIIVGSGDVVSQYVLLVNSHDGSLAITAMPTNVRVVCNNTLTAALASNKDKIKIRHTTNAKDRMHEAAAVLNLLSNNTQMNEDAYNKMREFAITKEDMFSYFGNVFCSPDEIKSLRSGTRAAEALSTRKQNILAEVLNFSNSGIGQELAMVNGNNTMWSAYNAVTGYITRKKYKTANDRANSMLFGTSAELIQSAGALAVAPEKIQRLHKVNAYEGIILN
jgi:phage/plasmid-like protein (TIGR03299 family)